MKTLFLEFSRFYYCIHPYWESKEKYFEMFYVLWNDPCRSEQNTVKTNELNVCFPKFLSTHKDQDRHPSSFVSVILVILPVMNGGLQKWHVFSSLFYNWKYLFVFISFQRFLNVDFQEYCCSYSLSCTKDKIWEKFWICCVHQG